MFKIYDKIGSNKQLTLTSAILIYNPDDSKEASMATLHPVDQMEKKCVIMPGSPITPDVVQNLMASLLNVEAGLSFLDGNILGTTPTSMVWWCPASRRRLWFQQRDKKLMKYDGEMFPNPSLVFMAYGDNLAIYAVKGTKRPTLATKLWKAPYLNIYDTGSMCNGTARMPHQAIPKNIPHYEAAFFNSRGVHSNEARLVKYPHNHDTLWLSLKGKREFPESFLMPFGRRGSKGGKAGKQPTLESLFNIQSQSE